MPFPFIRDHISLRSGAVLMTALCLAPPALAQPPRSAPVDQPRPSGIPAPRDIAWPAAPMRVEVDATNVAQRILSVRQTIPLPGPGPLVLRLPEWLPGNHAPRGVIDKIAGLRFTANGRPVAWTRDPVDMFAFHVDPPADAATLVAEFQFLSPTKADQGRIVFTDAMLNLQWPSVSLYPAGYYVRRVPVEASVTLPPGWTAFTALRGRSAGATTRYDQTDYETLIDSPLFAGRHARSIDLGEDVTLRMIADDPAEIVPGAAQIAAHRALVAETLALFGARHYDHYDFLFAVSDQLGPIGLEHHRSSENGVDPGYFTRWDEGPGDRGLLPHEFVHSWNGKFRRPALLWTPDYATPMQDDLLWVYEGQTQFWGYVLAARAGLYSKQQALDAFASIAARLDLARGRTWRPLADTTGDPIIAARRPKGWATWQRSEDYYNEGLMIWLEADAIIRAGTGGERGLDDVARAFFGMRDGDWGVLTYTRADIVRALGSVHAYDWDGFLTARIDRTSGEVSKAGLTLGGYTLVYGATPNSAVRASEMERNVVEQSFGAGLTVGNDGEVVGVVWDSPAFRAGMAVGNRIVAVNGTEYSPALFRQALAETTDPARPIELILRQDKRYRTIRLDYSGGIRYPRLQKTIEGEGSLDRLLSARRSTDKRP
jgi:predicted metalloprotease with PDZ domain